MVGQKPLGAQAPMTNADNIATAKPLYNGNIVAMLVNIPKIGTSQLYGYKYDQLNRIVAMDVFTGLNTATNVFTPVATQNYKERVSYDANGNILTYLRNGSLQGAMPQAMDNLTYQYEKDNLTGKPLSNKLRYVHDQVAATNYTEDIDNQTTLTLAQVQAENAAAQPTDNYTYDAIGNLIQDTKEGISNITWNVYGKISSITKATGNILYSYDASGNRISKTVAGKTTWYVRDASGNVMSTYESGGINGGALTQTELHLYGSSRLGIYNANKNMQANSGNSTTFIRGNKFFELSNHLGNVLVTVSDRKNAVSANNTTIDYYTADVATASDYYPFGMVMPNRKFSGTSEYRYGFNGKENDKDISTSGQDFGERIYNNRLGKFLSVDPYYKNFPFYSPYLFAGNSPIKNIDENGGYKIDGTIKSKYPKIYKYLSKNLEKEMLSSSIVAHGFKQLNPKLTNDNLKEMFTFGSGPTINSDKAPGMFAEATAKYDFEDRSININEKIFSYVEGVLKNKKSTKEEKTRALTFLKIVIAHETGHDAEKSTGGLNADGTPKMVTSPTEQRKLQNELNIGEAGYELTEYIYGLPASKNIINKDKKELVPKIRGGNDGNKVEVLDNVIKKANSTDEGKQTLPTLPDDDKKTPVIK